MPQTMLPGVLLLVAAAEAGAAAAVEAGEAAWGDSSTSAVPAGLTLLAMSSLDFLVPSPFGPADGRLGGGSLSVRFVMARVVVGLGM